MYKEELETIRLWGDTQSGPGRAPAFDDWEPPLEDIDLLVRRWANSFNFQTKYSYQSWPWYYIQYSHSRMNY